MLYDSKKCTKRLKILYGCKVTAFFNIKTQNLSTFLKDECVGLMMTLIT